MTDWVIVPVKSIANGKTRLAPILGRPRRQRLNRAFLLHTLGVASATVGAGQVVVVSHCAETRRIANALGVVPLREPRGIGLNEALALARDHAISRGGTGGLVLPSDLPLSAPSDLRHVLHLGRRRKAIVVCRDRHGRGTNALYLNRLSGFRFQFGDESAARHTEEAARSGLPAVCVDRPTLAFDIDTPRDHRDWCAMKYRPSPRRNASRKLVR